MEKESCDFLNSPVIRNNTPLKRLGLSRKRKSCGSDSSPNTKIPAFDKKIFNDPSHSEKFALEQNILSDTKDGDDDTDPRINYDEEVELLKVKITEEEEKLKTFQYNKNKIEQLENLIELWKNGCKNAFLHFSQLLKDKDSENIDLKAVLNKLGVWETMIKNFKDDPDISCLENSQ